jgi:hypothetical protein
MHRSRTRNTLAQCPKPSDPSDVKEKSCFTPPVHTAPTYERQGTRYRKQRSDRRRSDRHAALTRKGLTPRHGDAGHMLSEACLGPCLAPAGVAPERVAMLPEHKTGQHARSATLPMR